MEYLLHYKSKVLATYINCKIRQKITCQGHLDYTIAFCCKKKRGICALHCS